ncbi:MAG: hypothetical protein R3C53_11645 [Pirellulaceae bacterium]
MYQVIRITLLGDYEHALLGVLVVSDHQVDYQISLDDQNAFDTVIIDVMPLQSSGGVCKLGSRSRLGIGLPSLSHLWTAASNDLWLRTALAKRLKPQNN